MSPKVVMFRCMNISRNNFHWLGCMVMLALIGSWAIKSSLYRWSQADPPPSSFMLALQQFRWRTVHQVSVTPLILVSSVDIILSPWPYSSWVIGSDDLKRNLMLDGELYVAVTSWNWRAMLVELQWIIPAPPFDAGRKTRSRLILVDRLTLPNVAVKGILWSLSIWAVDNRWAMSGYPIDRWIYWLLAVRSWFMSVSNCPLKMPWLPATAPAPVAPLDMM